MVFLSCLYDGRDPSTYEGIEIKMSTKAKPEVVNTGDPAHDYLTAGFIAQARTMGTDTPIMGMSSVDHFSMDGGVGLGEHSTDEQDVEAIKAAKEFFKKTGELEEIQRRMDEDDD